MAGRGLDPQVIENTRIGQGLTKYMAHLAIIGGHSINGVAKLTQNYQRRYLGVISTVSTQRSLITRPMGLSSVAGCKLRIGLCQLRLMASGRAGEVTIHELHSFLEFKDNPQVLGDFTE